MYIDDVRGSNSFRLLVWSLTGLSFWVMHTPQTTATIVHNVKILNSQLYSGFLSAEAVNTHSSKALLKLWVLKTTVIYSGVLRTGTKVCQAGFWTILL